MYSRDIIYDHTYNFYGYDSYTLPYSTDCKKIADLKKALKDKHLNPALRVQYAKELQRLEK